MIRGIGSRLRNLRSTTGMTQREVALKLYVSPSLLSAYETEKRTPPAEMLLKLSDIYCSSPSYILGYEDPSQRSYLDISHLTMSDRRAIYRMVQDLYKWD